MKFFSVIPAIVLIFLLSLSGAAFAVQPSEKFADPQLEARARSLSADLRCLVCQNQSIDDSDADLAHDLRVLVRERLQAGDTDAQVKQYLVDRYGDYVLLDPPFKVSTLALWMGPPVFVLAGLAAVLVFYRRRKEAAADPARPLSTEEQQRIADLMKPQQTGKTAL